MTAPERAHTDNCAHPVRPRVAVVIPALDEEEPIAGVVRTEATGCRDETAARQRECCA